MYRVGGHNRVTSAAVSNITPITCGDGSELLWNQRRLMNLPGWKTRNSTKDSRTRERKEADRKARQLDKLPKPNAIPSHSVEHDQKVLFTDQMFQIPAYKNDLDTPHLFNILPPMGVVNYWNCQDFERTDYPSVPMQDHRQLKPGNDDPEWQEHIIMANDYHTKHGIVPAFVPHVLNNVNLSVCYNGMYATRAKRAEDGSSLHPRPPVKKLTKRNFWFTAHCGNFIELFELQTEPSIFLNPCEHDISEDAHYTLVIASPDYPYRLKPSGQGFFLHSMVCNIPAKGDPNLRREGTVVVPYVPPLPTEDAGTTRHICMLYKQNGGKITKGNLRAPTPQEEREVFPFPHRCNFRMHEPKGREGFKALSTVEEVLPVEASQLTFFQTKWDICVQEFYESVGLPEPAYEIEDNLDSVLDFLAKDPRELRVRGRKRPDGSTNEGEDYGPNYKVNDRFWGQVEPTRIYDGSMANQMWSRRTRTGTNNGKPMLFPRF